MESPQFGRPQPAIAFQFPATDAPLSCSPLTVPTRLRKRLSDTKPPSLSTVEEIEAKLRQADLRRQKFYENLTSKAKTKPRGPQFSSLKDDKGQRLKAKLLAAEEKRLRILNNERMRLAKLDESRQTLKMEWEMRFQKKCAELGEKVEMRARQAEANRLRILRAYRQRMASVKERTSQLLMQHADRNRKYKERVRNAMYQKRAAAQKKRLGLLEAEKKRAHARALQVQNAANSLTRMQEIKRSEMEKKLEDRLKRARKKKVESLQKGRSCNSVDCNWNLKQDKADILSRKLARCWRQFKRLQKPTAHLAEAYNELNINERSVKSMPFEQFAALMQSTATLCTLKLLLDRLERRYELSQAVGSAPNPSSWNDIEHLLKRVASPKPKQSPRRTFSIRNEKKTASVKQSSEKAPVKLSRYEAKIMLCAYMIVGHPDTVISKKWEPEMALVKSAGVFVYEFELLIKIILNGPMLASNEKFDPELVTRRTFRLQLAAFDAAWCAFLNSFVVWKAKDATSLEEDLITAACRLEISMLQTCKMTPEGITDQLSFAMSTVQKQVSEDHKLLREKVLHLSGNAGIERLEKALSDTRKKYFDARESRSVILPASSSSGRFNKETDLAASSPKQTSAVQLLFGDVVNSKENKNTASSSSISLCQGESQQTSVVQLLIGDVVNSKEDKNIASSSSISLCQGESLDLKNVIMVNEFVHGEHIMFSDSLSLPGEYQKFMEKWKETIENAYWDGILESVKQDEPDYSHILKLITEIRDEIYVMAPRSWKQKFFEEMDLENLTQAMNSGSFDFAVLSKILESATSALQKLCAPAYEEEMKKKHQKFIEELDQTFWASDISDNSQAIALIKGLNYVLQEIQQLKKEISKARIRMIEPILKGPEALKYLGKSFTNRYGDPSKAVAALPLTAEWLSLVRGGKDVEWFEHKKALSVLPRKYESPSSSLPSTTLRTGGNLLIKIGGNFPAVSSTSGATDCIETSGSNLECKGEEIDLLVRLGLIRLVTKTAGLTEEQIPETMNLNLNRLRSTQSQIQKIIVIAISLLVLQQALFTEQIVPSQSKMESILLSSFKSLCTCLDSLADAKVQDIVDMLMSAVEEDNKVVKTKLESMKEIMGRMLAKSLEEENAVFGRVSGAIYLGIKRVVLGGNGRQGRGLAEMVLQKGGASLLMEKVMEVGSTLAMMAKVSVSVHGPWYANLIKD